MLVVGVVYSFFWKRPIPECQFPFEMQEGMMGLAARSAHLMPYYAMLADVTIWNPIVDSSSAPSKHTQRHYSLPNTWDRFTTITTAGRILLVVKRSRRFTACYLSVFLPVCLHMLHLTLFVPTAHAFRLISWQWKNCDGKTMRISGGSSSHSLYLSKMCSRVYRVWGRKNWKI